MDASWIEVEDPSLYYLLNFPYHLWKIRNIVKSLNIDVILSANILPSFAANFAGAPVVFDYLDHLEESASIYYPGSALGEIVKQVVSLITKYNLRHARSVITVTKELSEFLQDLGVKDITVIPNGVDTKVLRPMPMEEAKKSLGLKGVVLGYVGSLEHWVDLETVVQALPNLDATLLVVGPGLFTDYGEHDKEDGRGSGCCRQGCLHGRCEVLRALPVYLRHGHRPQSPEDDEEERVRSRGKGLQLSGLRPAGALQPHDLPGEAAGGRDILL